jgi:hypothetical protein
VTETLDPELKVPVDLGHSEQIAGRALTGHVGAQGSSLGAGSRAVASRRGEEIHSLVDALNSLGQSVSGGG